MYTKRRRLRQNRCVFSTRRNCPRDRSRWRRLSGRLFHSSIVLMVYGFSQNLLFSHCTDAGQHLSIIPQVHGLCLGLTGRLREKPDKKLVRVKRHMWTLHLKKWGSVDPLDPWLRGPCQWCNMNENSAFFHRFTCYCTADYYA